MGYHYVKLFPNQFRLPLHRSVMVAPGLRSRLRQKTQILLGISMSESIKGFDEGCDQSSELRLANFH